MSNGLWTVLLKEIVGNSCSKKMSFSEPCSHLGSKRNECSS
jgi:hypothetical protein